MAKEMPLTKAKVEKQIGSDVDVYRQGSGYRAEANWERGAASIFAPTQAEALEQLLGYIIGARKYLVAERAKWRCQNCSALAPGSVHHKVFRSHGGMWALDNLEFLCNNCHASKHGIKAGHA